MMTSNLNRELDKTLMLSSQGWCNNLLRWQAWVNNNSSLSQTSITLELHRPSNLSNNSCRETPLRLLRQMAPKIRYRSSSSSWCSCSRTRAWIREREVPNKISPTQFMAKGWCRPHRCLHNLSKKHEWMSNHSNIWGSTRPIRVISIWLMRHLTKVWHLPIWDSIWALEEQPITIHAWVDIRPKSLGEEALYQNNRNSTRTSNWTSRNHSKLHSSNFYLHKPTTWETCLSPPFLLSPNSSPSSSLSNNSPQANTKTTSRTQETVLRHKTLLSSGPARSHLSKIFTWRTRNQKLCGHLRSHQHPMREASIGYPNSQRRRNQKRAGIRIGRWPMDRKRAPCPFNGPPRSNSKPVRRMTFKPKANINLWVVD